ncbi:MAG TPA: asparagine synthase-related protein [Candidatus Omnitrophota bacterium]|nr:asparagine synthase-related protein [Candidatus Omnitrophota bacterium]
MQGIFGCFKKKDISCLSARSLIEKMSAILGEGQSLQPKRIYINKKTELSFYGNSSNFKARTFKTHEQVLHIILHGKIFNFTSDALISYRSDGMDDLEKIRDLYEKHKENTGLFLDGEFNVVIYDEFLGRLTILNDRFGFKNLYFYEDENLFIFGPTIASLLVYAHTNKRIDISSVSDFFHYGYLLSNKTLFKEIKMLRGGSVLIIDSDNPGVTKQYWDFHSVDKNSSGTLQSCAEKTFSLLSAAVKKRVEGNSRIIVQISGGLDSRMIAALVRAAGREFAAVTFGARKCREVLLAREVVVKLRCDSHLIKEIRPQGFVGSIMETLKNTECQCESLGLSGPYSTMKETLANNQFDLLLGGFCGDLILGGSFLRRDGVINSNENLDQVAQYLFNLMEGPELAPFQASIFTEVMQENFTRYRLSNIKNELKIISDKVDSYGDLLDWFIITNKIFHFINYAQRNNTIHVKEFYPFFDYEFFDFVYSLPLSMRKKHRIYKEIYKMQFPELAEIPWLKSGVNLYSNPGKLRTFIRKQVISFSQAVSRLSFGKMNIDNPYAYANYDNWFRTDKTFRQIIEKVLMDPRTIERGYYSKTGLRNLLNMQKNGKNYFTLIDRLFTFEMWNRLFIDNQGVGNSMNAF